MSIFRSIKKKRDIGLWVYAFWPSIFLAICWGIWIYSTQIKELPKLGVYPRKAEGLLGILTSPFFHSTHDNLGNPDVSHIMNNSVPFMLLGTALFYHFKDLSYQIFIWLFIGTGVWLWSFGRSANHIGASGVVYALFGFIATSGFLRNNKNLMALSMLTVFLYGSMVWGIFPTDPNISWEGHLSGLLMGIVLAIYFKKRGPKDTVTFVSDENSRNEIMYGKDYWKTEEQIIAEQETEVHSSLEQPVQFTYTFIPKPKEEAKDNKEDK